MTPALDTVWVGMVSGLIMVFHEEDLLSWFHPYECYVRFLTCIPSAGPCEMEKAIVASGGKGFIPLVDGLEESFTEEENLSNKQCGTIIMWEAYDARVMRQVKLIEENSPGYLDNHNTVRQMIHKGGFRDGTHIVTTSFDDSSNRDEEEFEYDQIESLEEDYVMNDWSRRSGSVQMQTINSTGKEDIPGSQTQFKDEDNNADVPIIKVSATKTAASEEEINVKLVNSEQTFILTCSKPAQLDSVVNEIELKLSGQEWQLVYSVDGSEIEIETQEDFQHYLTVPNRPPLLVIIKDQSSDDSGTTSKSQCALDDISPLPLSENGSIQRENVQRCHDIVFNNDISSHTAITNTTDAAAATVTLAVKLFNSEETLELICAKPAILDSVMNDLEIIANLSDQEWCLVYSIDDSHNHIKIEDQEDFENYLDVPNRPLLWMTTYH